MPHLDEAAQLRIEQSQARRTRPSARRPFTPHVCADCAHPRPLDRATFLAEFVQAQRDACAVCLDAYPCELHR